MKTPKFLNSRALKVTALVIVFAMMTVAGIVVLPEQVEAANARAEARKAKFIAEVERRTKVNDCYAKRNNVVHLYFNVFQMPSGGRVNVSREMYGACWTDPDPEFAAMFGDL